jgi:protein SCO1/2
MVRDGKGAGTMSRIAFILLFIVLACPGEARAFDPLTAARIDRRPNAQIPMDQALLDRTGQTSSLRAVAGGRPILLVPVQYECPNICGVTLAGLLQAITRQKFKPDADFTLVTFGIDPAESPPDAAKLAARLGAEFPSIPPDTIHGLTGRAADIAAMTDALGYRYAWDPDLRQFDHVAAVAVLTPDGRLSNWLYGVAPEPRDLQLALTAAGVGQVGRWTDQLLLLCYHYDPVSGRYTPIVWTALRILAAGALAIALLCLARALLRERRLTKRRPS